MEDDDPSDEDDARCVATKGECDAAHAETISWHIDHAVDILGENVGPLDTDNGETHNVTRALVVPRPSLGTCGQHGIYYRLTRSFVLPDDWNTKVESNMGAVEHEVSHDFFYKHLPSMSDDETSALNERNSYDCAGIYHTPIIFSDPSSENWHDAIADDDPHDAGRHRYIAYKRLSTALNSTRIARNVFLNAIRNFENIDNNMDASFLDFWVRQSNRSILMTS